MGNVRDRVKWRMKQLAEAEGGPSALAKALGVSKQTVGNWTNGKAAPDVEMMEVIAKKYGFTLSALMDDTEEFEYYLMDMKSDEILPTHKPSTIPHLIDLGETEGMNDQNTVDKRLNIAYLKLNEEGREKLLEYAEDLAGNKKYTD